MYVTILHMDGLKRDTVWEKVCETQGKQTGRDGTGVAESLPHVLRSLCDSV